jgi:translation initiation factor 2B subunit (eIF-2B alpha/beta/delta family)
MCLTAGDLLSKKELYSFCELKFGLYCFRHAGDVFNKIFHLIFFLPPQFTSCKLAKDLTKEPPQVDYTPPSYITLLFTDLGILTPSAVSDELIKLYL